MHNAERVGAELGRAGIRIEQEGWGTRQVYVGTRDAMIAAGLLSREQIPGEPGCPKTHVFRFEHAGRGHTASSVPPVVRSSAIAGRARGATLDELQEGHEITA